jgi:hypothetical protein
MCSIAAFGYFAGHCTMSLTSVGIAVLAVSLTILIIVYLADADHHKKRIVRLLRKRTGRDFRFQDRICFTLFPWLGLNLGGVRVGNAIGFDTGDFAAVDKVKLRMKVSPLVRRRLEIDTIRLQGMKVNLIRRADGRNNWEDLVRSAAITPGRPSPPSPQQSASPTANDEPIQASSGESERRTQRRRGQEQRDRARGGAEGSQPNTGDEPEAIERQEQAVPALPIELDKLNIQGIDIKQLELLFTDELTCSDHRFSVASFRTSAIRMDTPIQVQVRCAFAMNNANGFDGQFDVDTLASVRVRRSAHTPQTGAT